VSKNICAADSRFDRGFNGASVSSTGCWTDMSKRTQGHKRVPMDRAGSQVTHLLAERAQLFCINPVPDTLHIVPVGYDAVFHGILDPQQTPEFLGFPAYEDVALEGAGHDPGVLRPPDAVGLEREILIVRTPQAGLHATRKGRWGRTMRGKSILGGPGQRIRP
jgi:hypothetical protein